MARGLAAAPRWAWIVMTVSALLLTVAVVYTANRDLSDPLSPAQSHRMNASAAAAAESDRANTPIRILVIGDSYTAGSDEGGYGATGWPALVDADLDEVVIETAASGGSGYVAHGPDGYTFPGLIRWGAGAYDTVIFFGSRNDTAPGAEVRAAADAAFRMAREKSPEAALLVIGPPWVDANPPEAVLVSSQAVEDAAVAAGAKFVDPLDEGWFVDRPELIGSDGIHPTDEGHRYMADRIESVIRATLVGQAAR